MYTQLTATLCPATQPPVGPLNPIVDHRDWVNRHAHVSAESNMIHVAMLSFRSASRFIYIPPITDFFSPSYRSFNTRRL